MWMLRGPSTTKAYSSPFPPSLNKGVLNKGGLYFINAITLFSCMCPDLSKWMFNTVDDALPR